MTSVNLPAATANRPATSESDPRASSSMLASSSNSSSSKSSLIPRRRVVPLLASSAVLVVACSVVLSFLYVTIIDVPRSIYHCPLDIDAVIHDWNDEGGGCYWSTSYAEAKEKFVALGNHLKERRRERRHSTSAIVDVRSQSYDVFATTNEGYPSYLASLNTNDGSSSEIIRPGKDTIDAILLTLRIPHDDYEDYNDGMAMEANCSADADADANGIDDGCDGGRCRDRDRMGREHERNVDVIHTSGTHGVEGYLGSAVQIRFLHELLLRDNIDEIAAAADDDVVSPSPQSSSSSSSSERVRRVLLIHSVNPYGMRHHRRTNENNVDLNRNVLDRETWIKMRRRDPNEYHYVDMDASLNPFGGTTTGESFSWVDAARDGGYDGDVSRLARRDDEMAKEEGEMKSMMQGDDDDHVVGGPRRRHPTDLLDGPTSARDAIWAWMDEKRAVLRIIASISRQIIALGYTDAKRGLVTGQYHRKSGLSYGGGAHNSNGWENSILAVRHAITELGGYRFDRPDDSNEDDNGERPVVWVDVHTGLGRYGGYSLLTKNSGELGSGGGDGRDERSRAWMSEFASLLEGNGMGHGRSGDSGVSSGYDRTMGFINDEILCPSPFCMGITQEFGTRPGIGVAVALIMENAGHHSPASSGRRRACADYLTWAFYPHRNSWRRKTMRGGIEMLHAILNF